MISSTILYKSLWSMDVKLQFEYAARKHKTGNHVTTVQVIWRLENATALHVSET